MLAGKGLTVIADFFCEIINFDGLVKSRPQQQYVIPAKAGIQYFYHGTNMRKFSLLRNRTFYDCINFESFYGFRCR